MKFSLSDTMASFVQKPNLVFHFVWSLLLFLICKFTIGNYYEVYEAIPPTTLTGVLMDGVPANIIYPIASIGLSDFYVLLYRLNANITWYDYFMALYLITAAAVVFTAVHQTLKEGLPVWQIILLNTFIFLLFFADSILNWNYTRNSITICTAAFISLVLTPVHSKLTRQQIISLGLHTLLFAIGTMVRPESGALIFILSAAFFFCYHGFKKVAWLKIITLFIPILLIVGGTTLHRHISSEFFMQIEPITEYQIGLGNIAPINQMKTPEDSMKYVALQNGMVNDPGQISQAFIHQITDYKSAVVFNRSLLLRALHILNETIRQSFAWLLFNGAVLLYLLVFAGSAHQRFRYLFFHLFFWLTVSGIAYLMTMESRIFCPLLFFYSSVNIIFLLEQKHTTAAPQQRLVLYFFIAAISALTATTLLNMVSTRKDYEKNIALNHRQFYALQKIAAGKILAPDSYASMILFFNNFYPFQSPNFTAFKKIFLIDFEAYTLTPPYRKYANGNCQCNSTDLGEFYDYFYAHKNEVVFVGTNQRFQLIESYLKIVHHKNYSFQSGGLVNMSGGNFIQEMDSIKTYTFL